jgi:type I restriction enzyme, S subunit
MSEWKTYKLGEICKNIAYGYTESATSDVVGPKFLRITDIQYDFISWDKVPYCPITDENHKKYKLEIGDIVIARTGASTGATAIFKDEEIDAVFASYLIRYKIDKEIADPFYIGQLLKSALWKSYVSSIIGGSAQPGANAKQFADFEFPLPDLATQTQIAQILTSLDDKIELNLQMNQTLEAMAQALFKEWFVDFNCPNLDLLDAPDQKDSKNQGNQDHPKNQGSDNGLPKGWRMGKLNEVARIEIGRTPPRLEEEWFSKDEKDNKWISIRDMGQSGIYIFNTSEYLTNEAVAKFRIPVIPENTVILSFKLTIGRLAITTEKMLSNEAIAQINSNEFPPEYIYLYLKTYNWGSLGSTSSIATAVNSKTIKEMEILIPDTEISNLFIEVIRPTFEKIKYNSLQIQTLTQIRDTLLPKLMSGRLNLDLPDGQDAKDFTKTNKRNNQVNQTNPDNQG